MFLEIFLRLVDRDVMRGSVLSIYLGIIIGIGDELEGAGVSYFGVVGLCCCGYETESIFYDRWNTFWNSH